ncbi:LCP family protein [Harryflintia acetispora]|uniref:LCP family protein n=1 Tax=Harryflintia acetispora TaxID=1849041 RepID=UPI0018976FD4|nr:LCP family protein [Harryflintia acetispora]
MKNTFAKIAVTLALILLTVAVGIVALENQNKISRNTKKVTSSQQELLDNVKQETEVINVLAVGVDYSQKLTDVIMYVRYDPNASKAWVLSIPRDTYLGDEYPTGKINNVYKTKGEIQDLCDEVEERFLLPVDYYATITLESLGKIVDQIGGVPINIPKDLYENGQLVLPGGEQVLDGDAAQKFVRARKAYVDSDLGRINAQHDFLIAAMKQLQSLGKMEMLELVLDNFDAVQTNIPISKMISIASSAFTIQEEDIEMFTVPGVGKMNYSYAVYEVDTTALAEILNENFFTNPVEPQELDFPPIPPQPEPASSSEEEEDEDGESGEDGDEEEYVLGDPIYPDPRDYSAFSDGDYDKWFERNTIYPKIPKSSKKSSSNEEEEFEGGSSKKGNVKSSSEEEEGVVGNVFGE